MARAEDAGRVERAGDPTELDLHRVTLAVLYRAIVDAHRWQRTVNNPRLPKLHPFDWANGNSALRWLQGEDQGGIKLTDAANLLGVELEELQGIVFSPVVSDRLDELMTR